jgi:RNA polymerase sigma-70 factor (ECF subfamily)
MVEGRPAALVYNPTDTGSVPLYFILLEWADARVATIRDFRYARYVLEGAEWVLAE